MEINIKEILEELSFEALKKTCGIKNIKMESRKKMDYVEELSAYDWSDDELQKVIEIFRKDRENSVKAIISYLFKDSKIINLSPDEIRSKLTEDVADFTKEEISGFKIIKSEDNIIESEYWYTQKKMLVDDMGKIHYYRMPSRIKFKIRPLDGIAMIYALNPGLALKCKKALDEVLNMSATPISPLEVE